MKEGRIHIKAVGDISPGDCTINGLGILSISKKYGCNFLFENIRNELRTCDLLLGNLEGTLSNRCMTEDLRLCGLPDMAFALRGAGFDVLSMANNHVLDHGSEIFKETVSHCQEAGLMICGLRGNAEYYCQPVIIDKYGLKIGILAYNWVGLEEDHQSGDYIANVHDGIVNYTWNRNRELDVEVRKRIQLKNKDVIADIKKLRAHVDKIILMPHWGYEWTIYPPYGVTLEARSFIDAGADLILGSHPHVPQGIENYNNKIVAYSMGNFLFDSSTTKFRHGMIVDCILARYSNPDYNLSFIDRDTVFRPEVASIETSVRNMKMIEKSNAAVTAPDAQQILDDDLIYREYEKQYNILKIIKIVYFLKIMPHHPSTILPVLKKLLGLIRIILLRILGNKVRW